MAAPSQAGHGDLPFVKYLDNPILKKFIRKYAPGDYLFRQGDYGNTMFIIADGTVWLISEGESKEHVAAVLERGQFLGEKAVMGTQVHQRFLSARAKTYALVLELGLEDMDMVHSQMPDLMIDMLRRMFRIAALRLDRQNSLTRLLRSSDNVTRLVHLIIYLAQGAGRKVADGVEFVLNEDAIHYHIDMPPNLIASCIQELENCRTLRRVLNDYYILKDENALIEAIPQLREHASNALAQRATPPPLGFLRRKR